MEIIQFLLDEYPGILAERYQIEEEKDKAKCLMQIAINRQCKQKGDQVDYDKAALIVVDEFRNGKLGRITLEIPNGKKG